MVLAAVGKNGTGKDFFLEYVAKTYDFPMISIGDVVRELAAKDGLELTRDNLHATSKKYMSENGQTFFPEMIVKKIKESDAPNFLVSGIRPPSDIEVFKKALVISLFLLTLLSAMTKYVIIECLPEAPKETARALKSFVKTISTKKKSSTQAKARKWLTTS